MTPISHSPGTIAELEDRRRVSMLASDLDALLELSSDRLVYIHSSGDEDSRSSYLQKVSEGYFVYHRLAFDIVDVAVFSEVALVHGRISGLVDVANQRRDLDCSYLGIWTAEDGKWKFRAFQPTPILNKER